MTTETNETNKRPRRIGDSVFFAVIVTPIFLLGALVAGGIFGGVGALLTVPVALVGIAFVVRDPPKWLENAGCGLMVVSGVLWLGALAGAYFVFSVWSHLEHGSAHCQSFPLLAQQTSCVGRDHSVLQGRLNYCEAKGVPNVKECQRLTTSKPLLQPDKEHEIHHVDCPAQWQDVTCFESARLSGGGDMHRTLYGFAPDCSAARAWGATNVTWEEMPAKLASIAARGANVAAE